MRSESRSRIEYLIPTNNIIVFDSYFNLTNKSNLIDRRKYDLIRFFDNLVVAYFFWATLYIHYRYHESSLNRIKTRHVRLDFSSISTTK